MRNLPVVPFCRRLVSCSFWYSEVIFSSFRADTRGVRVVTNVGRNAVDVEALTDERRLSRTVKSCGPGAPKSGAKSALMLAHHAGEGGKRDGSPRRSRSKP